MFIFNGKCSPSLAKANHYILEMLIDYCLKHKGPFIRMQIGMASYFANNFLEHLEEVVKKIHLSKPVRYANEVMKSAFVSMTPRVEQPPFL